MALSAVACGDGTVDAETATTASSSEATSTLAPDPWAGVEKSFMSACLETDGGTIEIETLETYCRCSYSEVVEFYGTVEALNEADVDFGANPEAFDPLLQAAVDGCANVHLD